MPGYIKARNPETKKMDTYRSDDQGRPRRDLGPVIPEGDEPEFEELTGESQPDANRPGTAHNLGERRPNEGTERGRQ